MKIPQSGSGPLLKEEDGCESIIHNKYSGKPELTREEAIDQINNLSGMLLVDGRYTKIVGEKDAGYKAL